jgi:hypothetical protein
MGSISQETLGDCQGIRKKFKPGVMAHAYNPSYWEEEIRRTTVRGQPGKRVLKVPSQPMAGHGGT